MNLTRYYINQAGGGGGVGPIYSIPTFVQRGHGLGDILGGLFRSIKPFFFSGIRTTGKEAAKALGREALRTGGRILSDIADNPQVGYRNIISNHVQDSFQNLSARMTGRGRKRKRNRRSTSHISRTSKRPKPSVSRLRKTKRIPKRKRIILKAKRRNTSAIKRDFS